MSISCLFPCAIEHQIQQHEHLFDIGCCTIECNDRWTKKISIGLTYRDLYTNPINPLYNFI